AEQKPGAGVPQDEGDGRRREAEVDRHRHEAGAQDAVVGGEKLGAVGREDADALAALQAVRRERARHAVRHPVELAVAELARRRFAAEIDERDLVEIALAPDEIAKVGEGYCHVFGGVVRYVPRPLANSLPPSSNTCASETENWLPHLTMRPRAIKSPGM